MQVIKKSDLKEFLKREQAVKLYFLAALNNVDLRKNKDKKQNYLINQAAEKDINILEKTLRRAIDIEDKTLMTSRTENDFKDFFNIDDEYGDYFKNTGSCGPVSLKYFVEKPEMIDRELIETDSNYNSIWRKLREDAQQSTEVFYNTAKTISCLYDIKFSVSCEIDQHYFNGEHFEEIILKDIITYKDIAIYSEALRKDYNVIVKESIENKHNQFLPLYFWGKITSVTLSNNTQAKEYSFNEFIKRTAELYKNADNIFFA